MNVVADIGNSQIKIAIDRKNDISRVKAFRLNDFVNIKKYLKSLNHNTESDLFYSSVLDTKYDIKLIKSLSSCLGKIIRFKSTRSLLSTTNSYKKASSLGHKLWRLKISLKKTVL